MIFRKSQKKVTLLLLHACIHCFQLIQGYPHPVKVFICPSRLEIIIKTTRTEHIQHHQLRLLSLQRFFQIIIAVPERLLRAGHQVRCHAVFVPEQLRIHVAVNVAAAQKKYVDFIFRLHIQIPRLIDSMRRFDTQNPI